MSENSLHKLHNFRPHKKNHKGFTLVELIVTMMVLSIILSVSVMGLLSWQDWSEFNKMNEYAETMFYAAQNQLAEYSANGNLQDFSDRVYLDGERDIKVTLDDIYYDEGKTFTEEYGKDNSVWNTSDPGTLVSVTSEYGDYERYMQGADTKSDTAPFVFELLGSYIYDTSLLNGTICIEFSLEDGQVFSVLYTDKVDNSGSTPNEKFVYDNDNENVRGTVNIASRYESYRKERMIGYYGVDSLSKAINGKKQSVSITDLMLINEDTLNLSFKVSGIKSATTQLNYDITVYDTNPVNGGDSVPVLKFTLNGNLKNELNREEQICTFTRFNYDAASGNWVEEDLGEMPVLAWIDSDNAIRVILDGADIQATTKLYKDDIDSLKETYSFHRFGLDAENIYCEVQGYGAMYKPTATKKSNTSHAYYGEGEKTEVLGIANYNYTIANGRHLYNMRYTTDLSEAELKAISAKHAAEDKIVMNYELVDDIDWQQFVADGYYFDTKSAGILVDEDHKDQFASFAMLKEHDSFVGDGDYVISGLRISEANNALADIYAEDDTEKPVGLFARNYGTLKDLNLDNIKVVSASDKVGAFCGIDITGADGFGVLENLSVMNTGKNTENASEILGKEHVGGIVGYLQGIQGDSGNMKTYNFEDLSNAAKVSGNKYVGGIVGEIRIPKNQMVSVLVEDCENTGAVIARTDNLPTGYDKSELMYIGGIVGYSANMYEGNDGSKNVNLIRYVHCSSVPEYADVDLQEILDLDATGAKSQLAAKLNGVYVGGIVGYNYYSSIENCNTVNDSGKVGYVFGDTYVGGICGFNLGPASGIKGGDSSTKGINGANVVGNKYVGGITGCNAGIDREETLKEIRTIAINDTTIPDATLRNQVNAILGKSNANITDTEVQILLAATDVVVTPSKTKKPSVVLEQWTNKGVVLATDSYAGGISGYNAGWIYNCDSRVDNSHTTNFFQYTYSGDYAGGIAGYNSGIIGNTLRDANNSYKISASETRTPEQRSISANCYVTGENYVGGIVGYNDENAIVEDYKLVSGRILGLDNSCFVGGYAGFNASVYLLQDENGNARIIESNPNQVKGGYFVGGTIGGNIINTNTLSFGEYDGDIHGEIDMTPDSSPNIWGEVNTEKTNIWGTDSNRQGYVTITVHNDTDQIVSGWKVVANPMYDDKYFPLTSTGNDIWDEENQTGRPSNQGNEALQPHKSRDITFYVAKTTTNDVNAFFDQNKHMTVKYFDTSRNVQGQYAGYATNPSDISFAWNTYESGSVNQHGRYQLVIVNITPHAMPNWRMELTLPEGAVVSSVPSNINYQVVNGTLVLTGKDKDYLPGNNNGEYMGINIDFAKKDDAIAFESQTPIITSNNVVYYGQDRVTPNGSGGAGSGSDAPVKVLNAKFTTDNILGQLTGKAFTGGFVGYNLLLDNADAGYENGYVYALQNSIVDGISANVNDRKSQFDIVNGIANANFAGVAAVKESDVMLYVEGDENKDNSNNLGSISADICVAGVVGFNDPNTMLYIKNVVNATPVTAYMAIENASEQEDRTTDYNGDDIIYTYSYAGGIIGKVGKNTTLDNCKNTASGIVTSAGIYNGSLCEINEGLIKNCSVSVTGSGVSEYVAGICGLNKISGSIEDCVIEDISVNGRNVVGGMVAENYGVIKNPTISGASLTVTGKSTGNMRAITPSRTDGLAGSVAAFNGSTGSITLKSDIENINIVSKGDNVGGLVGINEGFILNESDKGEIVITGSIQGKTNVGGLIGTNASSFVVSGGKDYVSNYTNKATVTSTNGNAGGIIGNNKSNNVIYNCKNYGNVSATESGNAGGIVAENSSTISNCFNYESVKAPNGMCGGITAVSHSGAVIDHCMVAPVDASTPLVFASRETVGGITAINDGNINECKVSNIELYNYIDSDISNIGAVAGINNGTIKLAAGLGNSVADCSVMTYTDYSNIGGVAGFNKGTIEGAELTSGSTPKPTTIMTCKVGFKSLTVQQIANGESKATQASMGGVAGRNEGIVRRISVNGNIEGNLGDANAGYGGIVGILGDGKKSAYIEDCSFDGLIHCQGAANKRAAIGGIVGRVCKQARVERCWIGLLADDSETIIFSGDMSHYPAIDKSSCSNLGGIAGENYGSIYHCDNKKYSTDNVSIIGYAGNIGGIVGQNFEYAVVTGSSEDVIISTSDNWSIKVLYNDNDNGTGGIIGKSVSGEDMTYIKNYAYVANLFEKGNANNSCVGGIVGRIENQTNPNTKFSYLYNYANLSGNNYAAGIAGNVKYFGLELDHCYNYGDFVGNAKQTGGIVCRKFAWDSPISFTNCENHGTLKSSERAGGMLSTTADKNCKCTFYNCVNTGNFVGIGISSSNYSYTGGMAGNIQTDGNGSYFINCRNYGTGMKYGICGTINNPAYMKNCLDLSGTTGYDATRGPLIGRENGKITAKELAFNDKNYFINANSLTYAGEAATWKDGFGEQLTVTASGTNYIVKPYGALDSSAMILVNNPAASAYYGDSNSYNASLSANIKDTRIPTYLEIDQKCKEFIYGQYDLTHKLDKTTSVSLTPASSKYRIMWNAVADAADYSISYRLLESDGSTLARDANGNPVLDVKDLLVGANRIDIELVNNWGEKGYKLEVSVVAVSAYHLLHMDDAGISTADLTQYDSDPYTKKFDTKMVLPMPMVHLEMVGANAFTIVLDNREDYKTENGYLDCYVEISNGQLKGLKIQVASSDYSFTTADTTCDFTGNQTIDFRAVPNASISSKYVTSQTQTKVVAVLGSKDLQKTYNTKCYTVEFKGFRGSTTNSLAYMVNYKNVNVGKSSGVIHVASDIVAFDDEVGVDVSYGHSNTMITFSGESSALINNLPADFAGREKITIYSYPWEGQSNVMKYGRVVYENINLMKFEGADAELVSKEIDGVTYYNPKKLVDNGYYVVSGTSCTRSTNGIYENGSLKKGYLIYKNVDGTYNVIYNACLALETTDLFYQVVKDEYTLAASADSDGYEYYTSSNGDKLRIMPMPVIDTTDVVIATNAVTGKTSYSFKWDQGVSATDPRYTDAKYNVELFGLTIDGHRVALDIQPELTTNEATFEDENSNWNYPIYELQVTRVGIEETGTDKTVILPRKAVEHINVKVRMDSIVAPSVQLNKVNGDFDKDHLDYVVTWAPIIDQNQLDDLGGYLIEAKTADGGASHVHYYYVQDVLDPSDEIGLNLPVLSASSPVTAVSYVTSANPELKSALINVSDFAGGSKVNISVYAIAKKNSTYYRDGLSSGAYELTIPTRLPAKSADLMTSSATYDIGNPSSVDDLNDNGITLEVSDASEAANLGQYQIAIAIYDEAGKLAADSDAVANASSVAIVANSGDAPTSTSIGYWNSGAKVTLITKASKTVMTGDNLDHGSYVVKKKSGFDLSDYAGMWMKVVIRQTADGSISSNWSDEDAAAGSTVNYKWIQIPAVKVESAGLTDNSSLADRKQYYDTTANTWATEADASDSWIITNRSLIIEPQDYADCYKLEIVDKDGKVHILYIEPVENVSNEYKVYYVGPNAEDKETLSDSVIDSYAEYIGTINNTNKEIAIPYAFDYSFVPTTDADAVNTTVSASVMLKDDVVYVNLPDVISEGADVANMKDCNHAYDFTKYVSLQSLVKADNKARYVDSSIGSFKREKDGSTWKETLKEGSKTTDTVDVTSVATVSLAEDTDVKLSVETTDGHKLLCQICIYDKTDDHLTLTGYKYIAIELKAGTTDKYEGIINLLKTTYFKDNTKVLVRFAGMTSQGMTDWSDFYSIEKSGAGTKLTLP